MNPQRQKVTFDLNTPQLLTLEFDPPSQAREGKWGEQYMYWLAEEKTLWAEPLLHAKIKATRATAGDQILITKRKQKTQSGGYTVAWEVQRVTAQDLARAQAALEAGHQLAQELPPPAPPKHQTKHAPRRLPPSPPLDKRLPAEKFTPPPSRLADCLKEAIAACNAAQFNATSEDVRCLAITLFIQANGGRR